MTRRRDSRFSFTWKPQDRGITFRVGGWIFFVWAWREIGARKFHKSAGRCTR